MAIELRTISEDDFDTWQQVIGFAFAWDPRPDEREIWLQRAEFDRYLGAFVDGEMVGTGGAVSLTMTVPGGATLPFGGVTAIAVKPTHRRRGVLTAVMRSIVEQAKARREPLSALWASESAIYRRFGFGVAVEGEDLAVDRVHAALADDHSPVGRMRLLSGDEARTAVPPVYARATAGIPGTVTRKEADWGIYFFDPEHWREGASALRFALYERHGEAAGYVRYRQKEEWGDEGPKYELRVEDLQAVDGEAYRSLHRFCFGVDLVATIKLANRRVHEPISLLLAEPRRLRHTRRDRVWLRLMDVPSALSTRRYAVEGEVVLEVGDDLVPENSGRYLLRGGPDGAECARTGRDPQLRIGAADLGAAYLGNSSLPALAWLGRVQGEPEAVRRAHLMFQWPVPPWCTVTF